MQLFRNYNSCFTLKIYWIILQKFRLSYLKWRDGCSLEFQWERYNRKENIGEKDQHSKVISHSRYVLDLHDIFSKTLRNNVLLSPRIKLILPYSDDIEGQSFDIFKIRRAFEVERCAAWIRRNGLCNVALQFPDSLLQYAPIVAKQIEEDIGGQR